MTKWVQGINVKKDWTIEVKLPNPAVPVCDTCTGYVDRFPGGRLLGAVDKDTNHYVTWLE